MPTESWCVNLVHPWRRGVYNLILTGSAFMDPSLLFPKYNSEANAPNRALVDELLNCEDVLMNFIAASCNPAGEYLEFVRPTMRIDLSFTEGVQPLTFVGDLSSLVVTS